MLFRSSLENGTLSWESLADGAIQSFHIEDDLISTAHIKNSTVSLALVTSQVESFHIHDGSLNGSEFSTSIPGTKFSANSIAGDRFKSATIETSKYPAEIPRIKLVKDSIKLSRFNTSSTLFTSASIIKSDSVTGGDFLTNTINGTSLADRTLTAADFSAKLTSGVIPSRIVTAGKIKDGAISGAKLYSNAADSSDTKLLNHQSIDDNIITSAGIEDGSIKKSHLKTTEVDFQKLFNFGDGDNLKNADFLHQHNRPELVCPTNYTNLSGKLSYCISNADITANASNSVNKCALDNGVQGHVCNFQEYISACHADSSALSLNSGSNYLTSNYSSTKILGFKPPGSGCQYMVEPKPFNFDDAVDQKVRCCVNN